MPETKEGMDEKPEFVEIPPLVFLANKTGGIGQEPFEKDLVLVRFEGPCKHHGMGLAFFVTKEHYGSGKYDAETYACLQSTLNGLLEDMLFLVSGNERALKHLLGREPSQEEMRRALEAVDAKEREEQERARAEFEEQIGKMLGGGSENMPFDVPPTLN